MSLAILGRSDEAIREIEMAPIFPGTHWVLGMSYLEKGMFKEALAEFQAENEITLQKFQDKIKGLPFSPSALSVMYLQLDDRDKAIVYLEKAFEARDNWLRYIKVMPLNDPIRDDPRFQAVLKKMGLD